MLRPLMASWTAAEAVNKGGIGQPLRPFIAGDLNFINPASTDLMIFINPASNFKLIFINPDSTYTVFFINSASSFTEIFHQFRCHVQGNIFCNLDSIYTVIFFINTPSDDIVIFSSI